MIKHAAVFAVSVLAVLVAVHFYRAHSLPMSEYLG